jgi:chemotaxis protein MotB
MEEQAHPQIIIIKRRGGHEEEHHGGAWKIAFADFMTAMMAFFLVLWIISATDKNTKAIIARYFNPVKLEESARTPKSIRGDGSANPALSSPDVTPNPDSSLPGDAANDVPPAGKKDIVNTANGLDKPDRRPPGSAADMGDPASPKATMSEGVLFADPYRSLDVIAKAGSPNELAVMQRDKADGAAPDADGLADPFRSAAGQPAGAPTPPAPSSSPAPVAEAQASPAPEASPAPQASPAAQASPAPSPQAAASPAPSEAKPSAAAAAARLQKELEQKVGAVVGKQLGPAIEVKATDEGLLITLTDKLNYSMFALGSAEPQPQVIQAMDAVAGILKARNGTLVVRGYTDAHPYRSATYDNWRLSSARAQMAYYMLTRGGLLESRFERIEGYGDKRLRDPVHPLGAENRRIEVLLREDKP